MSISPQTEWHRQLLAPFAPSYAATARLTLLCDPDRIYDDPALVAYLLQKGFTLLRLEDPITFRLAYERGFRSQWANGAATSPLIVLSQLEPAQVPFDISAETDADRILTLRLVEYFPALDGAVLQEVDRSHLATLWQRYQQSQPLQTNASSTSDWLLLHLFEFQPELLQTEANLLRALLSHHHQHRQLTPSLLGRLGQRLRPAFPDWPLAELWGNRATFLRFVSERWRGFIHSQLPAEQAAEAADAWFTVRGPESLPFGEPSVQVYLDTLLLEGAVESVRGVDPALLPEPWMQVGVAPLSPADKAERLRRHTESLAKQVPAEGAPHTEWLAFAERFADWLTARWAVTELEPDLASSFSALHLEIEQRFSGWFQEQFAALTTLPAFQPVMVDKVAHHMARGWATSGTPRERRALLVLDGMSLMQWPLFREELRREIPGLQMTESRIFAFVPTVTPVSRQALFSGELPSAFADSILMTQKEEARWGALWQQKGALKNGVAFLKQKDGEESAAFQARVAEVTANPAVRILGLVMGQIDKLTHGTSGIFDGAGLQTAVRHWVSSGAVAELVNALLNAGFTVWLTADHGHVGAVGVGKPQVGVLAEERSERVMVLTNHAHREKLAQEFPGSIPWHGPGLPEGYHPLLAGGLDAFTTTKSHSLSHGGISIEESVVPFIKLERVKE